MGLLSGMMGNAGRLDVAEAATEYGRLLAPGEQINLAYVLVRDAVLLTDRRIILVDKQGMTGKKISYQSIPWKSVHRFSVETAGHFDLDAELKVWVSGHEEPVIDQKLSKEVDVYEIQAHLASHVG